MSVSNLINTSSLSNADLNINSLVVSQNLNVNNIHVEGEIIIPNITVQNLECTQLTFNGINQTPLNTYYIIRGFVYQIALGSSLTNVLVYYIKVGRWVTAMVSQFTVQNNGITGIAGIQMSPPTNFPIDLLPYIPNIPEEGNILTNVALVSNSNPPISYPCNIILQINNNGSFAIISQENLIPSGGTLSLQYNLCFSYISQS